MSKSEDDQNARAEVIEDIASRGIQATPQAQNAIVQSILHAPGDISGDSDSLLMGLLRSGSYTVDALELAGVNPSRLQERAHESLSSPLANVSSEGHRMFFEVCAASGALLEHAALKGTLETADILRYAIAPVPLGEFRGVDLRESSLNEAMCSLVVDRLRELCAEVIYRGEAYPHRKFRDRSQPLDESDYFDHKFGSEVRHVAEYAVRSLNRWFCERRIDAHSTESFVEFMEVLNFEFSLDFGAGLFTQSGGDYETLEKSLTLSQRINPERDASSIVLCCQQDRIYAAEYTYRNSLEVDTPDSLNRPWQRLGIQAIRPVPLVSGVALSGLEAILSRESASESEIQQFLDRHPELLTSFGGYSGAHPHVLLREEGKSNMIPDYLLELPLCRSFDILDLKLPTAPLSAGHRYRRVSHELQKAVAQLRAYQNFFDKPKNRKWFIREYGLEPFRPEIVVVMGRSSEFRSRDDRLEIEQQLSPTRLLTYDDLIAYAQSRVIRSCPPNALG